MSEVLPGGRMECRACASTLDRPGDYCLVCHTRNTDAVVVATGRERATVTMLHEESIRGETTVTTTPETGSAERREVRNYVGRIADEINRKRPETVFVTGDRSLSRRLRAAVHYDVRRLPDTETPVETVLERRGDRSLAVVDAPPGEKIGGAHSTLVGDRTGQRAVTTVAAHPHVKKVIPGPIESGGARPGGGVRAKATRADGNGNVRMLLRDGSSVQENRVVTTAQDRDGGERIRADLNDALAAEDLQEETD